MLPVSITLLLTSIIGAQLMLRYSPKFSVRIGLVVLLVAIGILLSTIQPTLDGFGFGLSMALFGIGVGVLAAVLSNLVQSAVGERDRSEAGGLQNTATQLGTALGTAVIGAIVISGLATSFTTQIASDDRLSAEIQNAVEVELASGVTFISAGQLQAILAESDADTAITAAITENYAESQLEALRIALLATAVIVLIALAFTRGLPTERLADIASTQPEQEVERDSGA